DFRSDQPVSVGAAEWACRDGTDQNAPRLPALPADHLHHERPPLHARYFCFRSGGDRAARDRRGWQPREELACLRGRNVTTTKAECHEIRPMPNKAGFVSQDPKDFIGIHLKQSLAAFERATQDAAMLATARKIAEISIAALRAGNKLLLMGNGGSAGDAQHIAAEITGRYKLDRPAYAAIALTTDTSALTAIANDYGYEQVFSRQVEGLGRRGDVLIALSTS